MDSIRNIVLLGATGSIGQSTLEIVRRHPKRLRILGIAGKSKTAELVKIAKEFSVPHVSIFDSKAHKEIQSKLPKKCHLHPSGDEGLLHLARLEQADIILAATTGIGVLQASLEALKRQKTLAIANKEILVAAGKFIMEAAREHQAKILPVDSEHNAIFQCMRGEDPENIRRVILTASGGPFWKYSKKQLQEVTLQQALRHPNWKMGRKITIDSSTMANKALELIEAHWLFGQKPVHVVVHPPSIVHSMLECIDGSVLAQLSPPSMLFAIQYALLHPERAEAPAKTIDFTKALQLEFQPLDHDRFGFIQLAESALKTSGTAPAILNASNEIAVEAFLQNKIRYLQIFEIVQETLQKKSATEPEVLEDILEADRAARSIASTIVQKLTI